MYHPGGEVRLALYMTVVLIYVRRSLGPKSGPHILLHKILLFFDQPASTSQPSLLLSVPQISNLKPFMAERDDEPSQEMALRDRVIPKLSNATGHLEDRTLDLDARTLALLGKRQRLKVTSKHATNAVPTLTDVWREEDLWKGLISGFLYDTTCVLGINSMVRKRAPTADSRVDKQHSAYYKTASSMGDLLL